MDFLTKKYKVNNLSDLIFHKQIYKNVLKDLKNIDIDDINHWCLYPEPDAIMEVINNCETEDEIVAMGERIMTKMKMMPKNKDMRYKDCPNYLIFGPSGSGKHSLLNMLLEDMFDKNVHNVYKEVYRINNYGNSTEEIEILESDYHMIIEPSKGGIDKHIIHEIIRPYASKPLFNIRTDNYVPFKVIVINNAHNLLSCAQNALRCIMEKYGDLCKFILCTDHVSRITSPLRSRCLSIPVPSPSNADLRALIFHITSLENIKISDDVINDIITRSNNNVKTCIWLLEIYSKGDMDLSMSWKNKTQNIAKIICAFAKNPIININRRLLVNQYLHVNTYKKYVEQALFGQDKQKTDKIFANLLVHYMDLFTDDITISYSDYMKKQYSLYVVKNNLSIDNFKSINIANKKMLDEIEYINIKSLIASKQFDKKQYKFKPTELSLINKTTTYDNYAQHLHKEYQTSLLSYDEFLNNQDLTFQIFNNIMNAGTQLYASLYNNDTLEYIKDILYNMYITNICQDDILFELLLQILLFGKDLDPMLLIQIPLIFSNYEQHIIKGTRTVVHIESAIKQIFYHIYQHINK